MKDVKEAELISTTQALKVLLDQMTYGEQVLFLHRLSEAAFRILNRTVESEREKVKKGE